MKKETKRNTPVELDDDTLYEVNGGATSYDSCVCPACGKTFTENGCPYCGTDAVVIVRRPTEL